VPPVSRFVLPAFGLALLGCGAAHPAPNAPTTPAEPAIVQTVAKRPPPAKPQEHWYFEWLSADGKRALLRRLDGDARATLQTKIVDVDTGSTVEEETFPELAKIPFATIGASATELSPLAGLLAAPSFGDELVKGARLASAFPFGSWGRFSAAEGRAIAFNAGDWLYVADKEGHIRKRLSPDAAYDPRFTPDGKHLLFRRAAPSTERGRAKYELYVVPTDLSSAPRVLSGTAGARDRFTVDAEGRTAVAVASQEPQIKTCVLSIALRPPFAVKKLACLEGGEQLVESVLSPKGKWAAVTTQTKGVSDAEGPKLAWRLRVVSLTTGKVALDQPAEPGLLVRAVSDEGLLVQSGPRGAVVDDLASKTRRSLGDVELGHRGFFRGPTELVVVRGGDVSVVDVAKN